MTIGVTFLAGGAPCGGGKTAALFRQLPAFLLAFVAAPALAQSKNGFDLSNAVIPAGEILFGGPSRDGIPAIDDPKFTPVAEVDYLRDDDIVIGFGDRAYPNRVLVWHEVVNDVVDGRPVAVTYCPLCGTGMIFDAVVDGRRRSFGVSGLLFYSDVLLYDRESESLWSQLRAQAVAGPDVGVALTWLPSEHMTWAAWRERHPNGEALSLDTGHRRDYGGDAYAKYFASDATMFPVPNNRRELPNKSWVVGVVINGEAKAYPLDSLPDGENVADIVGGRAISVRYDRGIRHPQITDAAGKKLPAVVSFWFAWQAFYPRTLLWRR